MVAGVDGCRSFLRAVVRRMELTVRTVERGTVWPAWGVWACRAASSMLLGSCFCCGSCRDAECLTGQPPPPPVPLSKPSTVEEEVIPLVFGDVAGGEDRNQDVHDLREEGGSMGLLDRDAECFTGQPPPDGPDPSAPAEKLLDSIVSLSTGDAVVVFLVVAWR